MDTKLNNWTLQDKIFGLDYSSAKITFGDYNFDVRYDFCGHITRKNGVKNDVRPLCCDLILSIKYKKTLVRTKTFRTIEEAKEFSETWIQKEITNYNENIYK